MKWLRREWWVIVLIFAVIAFGIFYQAVTGTHAHLTFRGFEAFGSTHVAVFAIENRSVHALYFDYDCPLGAPVPQQLKSVCGLTPPGGRLYPEQETEFYVVADPIATVAGNPSFPAEVRVWRASVDDDTPMRRLQRWLPRWLTVDDSRVLRASVVKP